MNLPFQKTNNDTEAYIFLMKVFRTQKFSPNFYELIQYHLWGKIDTDKWYHNLFYLHDEDFLYFTLNMEDTSQFRYTFFESVDEIETILPTYMVPYFQKETSLQ
jgi:hypothetical protein